MDIKKILALTVLIFALFACMGAASAGLFDFFGGESTQTYTFDGFTLDIPESADVSYENLSGIVPYQDGNEIKEGYLDCNLYTVHMENGETIYVSSAEGAGAVSSIDEYIANMERAGVIAEGTYGEWTIINTNDAPLSMGNGMKVTQEYILVKFSGGKIITIYGNDLDQLKNIADSYKEV